jgi:hypothetical protein
MVQHKSIFTNLCQVTFQNSECLNYAMVEAWNITVPAQKETLILWSPSQ